jgi:hypothetical protein
VAQLVARDGLVVLNADDALLRAKAPGLRERFGRRRWVGLRSITTTRCQSAIEWRAPPAACGRAADAFFRREPTSARLPPCR